MNHLVEIDIILPDSPERVWSALTDRNALAEWLMPNDFTPRLGHRFQFRKKRTRRSTQTEAIHCQVIEMDFPCRLAYSWRESEESVPDLVTWTLEPCESGTRLRLEHTRLSYGTQPSASCNTCEGQFTEQMRGAISRLAQIAAGKTLRHQRGRVIVSSGERLLCVAVSPDLLRTEEVRG